MAERLRRSAGAGDAPRNGDDARRTAGASLFVIPAECGRRQGPCVGVADAGRSDVLHNVYSRTGPGSYGGVLAKGLTSMPETWDATMDGYQSLNHCMLGHVMEWFYGYVAGVRQQPGSVGWKRVLIAPAPGPLAHAEATLRTPRGEVASRWRIDGDEFEIRVAIPEGVDAEARLPSGAVHKLRAGSQTLHEHRAQPSALIGRASAGAGATP